MRLTDYLPILLKKNKLKTIFCWPKMAPNKVRQIVILQVQTGKITPFWNKIREIDILDILYDINLIYFWKLNTAYFSTAYSGLFCVK